MFSRFKTSIKRQLFVALASFTLFLCVSYTGLAVLIAYVTEDAVLESILTHEANNLQEHFSKTGTWKPPQASYMQLIPNFAHLPEPLKSKVHAANLRNDIRAEVFSKRLGQGQGQGHFHVIRLTDDPQAAYLVAEVSPLLVVNNLSKNLANFMLIVAFIMTTGALLLAYRLARRIASPLLQLNEEIRLSTQEQTLHTFSVANRTDEIGFLAKTLGRSLQSLHAALTRETLFTRDLSHELRTPVTILKNMMHRDATMTFNQDEQQLLRSSVAEIDHTVETLLALARAENLALHEIDLIAHLEHAILNLEKTAQAHQLHFTIEFDEHVFAKQFKTITNPHLLNLLFNNLLNNALFHGGDQVIIQIQIKPHRIIIGNTITHTTHQHASGLRHGTNLLQRIALALHWQLELHKDSDYFEAHIDCHRIEN
jgi:signal transduction histidine kinase